MNDDDRIMNELKAAYETLGLPQDAPKEAVEKRYFLLLKKNKTSQSVDVAAISHAYKTITQYELGRNIQQYEAKHYGNSKTKRVLDNFWHRYKLHVFLGIIVLILLVMGVDSVLEKRAERIALSKLPPADLEVMLVGEYRHESDELLSAAMTESFPEWQRIKAVVSYAPENPADQFDIGALQKNMIMLVTEQPDVYILDKHTFSQLAYQKSFMPLNDLDLQVEKERLLEAIPEGETASYVYGIDLTGVPHFEDWDVAGKQEWVLALRFDTEKIDNALYFAHKLLQTP